MLRGSMLGRVTELWGKMEACETGSAWVWSVRREWMEVWKEEGGA